MSEEMVIIRASIKNAENTPLLMHNGQLADPLNRYAKALKVITSKKKKTEVDLEDMAKAEWYGGLYYAEDIGVYIPGGVLEAAIINGAKKNKLGMAFKSAVFCNDNFALNYSGPKTPEKLWESGKFKDTRGAGVMGKRVMRTRPIFNEWSLDFEINVLPDCEVEVEQVKQALAVAGKMVGIGDYRPRYGRFTVESFEIL